MLLAVTISCFFFQAEDGIRDAQESRGLGDVYKRQLDAVRPTELILFGRDAGLDRVTPFLERLAGMAQFLSLIHI